MKKTLSVLIISLLSFYAVASESAIDTTTIRKTGWNFGPLPVIGYNSDLGFQYGACCDMFNYSDGSMFPNYRDHFYVEASRYTKQQTLAYLLYDSNYLIPGIRSVFGASYQLDPMYYFYGYNGLEPYVPSLNANKETHTARYSYWRSMIRVMADFQGDIIGPNFRWAAGAAFWHFKLKDLQIADYDPEKTLFMEYKNSGLVKPEETNGGSHLEFKLGLVYDSRDFAPSPSKGIWAEAFLTGAPDFFKSGSAYLKFCAHFRQYVSMGSDAFVFAYHLAYQSTIAGHTPFYLLQNIYNLKMLQTSSEGLGSANSLRSILPCRLLGEFAGLDFDHAAVRELDFLVDNVHFIVFLNVFLLKKGWLHTETIPEFPILTIDGDRAP